LKCLWLQGMLQIHPYPRGWTSTGGRPKEGMNNLLTSQLSVCWCINLNIKGLLTFFPQWDVGQLLTSASLITSSPHVEGAWKLLEVESSTLNKLWRLVHHFESNKNPTSSRDDTSLWVKLTPCWTSHTNGTCSLVTTYFHENPPTQWLKSSR